MNRTWTFLIGWVEGRPQAGDVKTGIRSVYDLLPGYLHNSEHVYSKTFTCATEYEAYTMGYAWAFHENFTALGTVSTVIDC